MEACERWRTRRTRRREERSREGHRGDVPPSSACAVAAPGTSSPRQADAHPSPSVYADSAAEGGCHVAGVSMAGRTAPWPLPARPKDPRAVRRPEGTKPSTTEKVPAIRGVAVQRNAAVSVAYAAACRCRGEVRMKSRRAARALDPTKPAKNGCRELHRATDSASHRSGVRLCIQWNFDSSNPLVNAAQSIITQSCTGTTR